MDQDSSSRFVSRRTFFISLFVVVILQVIGSVLFNNYFNSSQRVAFVRSDYLISNFQGTIEARIKLNETKQTLESNLDTLSANFDRALSFYQRQSASLTKKARIDWEAKLKIQQDQLEQYAQAVNDQVQMEDEKQVKAIINQINSFAADYARKNGLRMILSSSQGEGAVLYGVESLDITESLLQELNKTYKGE